MTVQAHTHLFARPRVSLEQRSDGSVLMRSEEVLREHERSLAHVLRARAEEHPERVLATQPAAGGARQALTFGDARTQANSLAQSFLDLGLSADRPLMVLSGNSLEHLVLMLACFTVGVPVIPVSVAYSLLSKDHERIRSIADLCSPGVVFADDAAQFGSALDALTAIVPTAMAARNLEGRPRALAFGELLVTTPGPAVQAALDRVGPETVAKLLFTSGSTGTPKGVINTHRMMCSNQQALLQVWPFLAQEPPVLVDWLPWSHTFGGNHNLNQVLTHGGTLHIDRGKPAPGLFGGTLAALRENPPTVYYNVPAGYALLVPELERDSEFAAAFFSRLRFVFNAGAALPQTLWERLRAVVPDHVAITASWGATETAPAATTAHFASARCGCIGVPLPGVTLKLAPQGDKLELRVSGLNLTPGYIGNPEATAAAFDDEGFYRTGDAGRLVNENDPNQGLLFDGRLAENFKLSSGTFVTVGALKSALLSACGGMLSDAVIAGHDQDYASALAWLSQENARRLCAASEDVPLDHPLVRLQLAESVADMNDNLGSASRIQRLLLLDEPPNMDAGEITDKGYVNQRAVLERRADLVTRLYTDPADAEVISPSRRHDHHSDLARP
jgi:feruloyl-CoA synthase